MSVEKQAVKQGCKTPEAPQRTENNDTTEKPRQRKKKSLGPDFETEMLEDSTFESGNIIIIALLSWCC